MTFEEMVWVALPLFAVGGLLAGIGKAIAESIGDSQHRYAVLWRRTRTLHPIVVGMALGLIRGLPLPPAMGESDAARLIWYGLAGALSALIYEVWQGLLKRKAGAA